MEEASVALSPLEQWADVGIEPLTCRNGQPTNYYATDREKPLSRVCWYGNFLRTGKPRAR